MITSAPPGLRPLTLVTAAALAGLGAPASALAYEDQMGLSVGLGGEVAMTDPVSGGPGATLTFAYGLGDTFELRVHADYLVHVTDETAHRVLGAVDLVYLLDILTVVPYFGVSAGGAVTVADRSTVGDLVLGAIVGIDFVLSRTFTLGLEVRPYVLPLHFDVESLALAGYARAQWLIEI